MQNAYTVEDIRSAERAVLARMPDGALMARAAQAVAVAAIRHVGFCYGARVLLLVGAGDNGGDALFAGAILARRGMRVQAVLAVPDRAHRPGLEAYRRAGGQLVTLAGAESTDLIIDGLLGIGVSGAVREELLPAVQFAERGTSPVIAVDVPSGLDPRTGATTGAAITATSTVCMGALKSGLLVGDGPSRAGTIEVVDLGLGPELGAPDVVRYDEADIDRLLPRPGVDDDKYTRGVVGVAAGSQEYPGAAELAVGSARLGGVGAVRYAGYAHREVSHRYADVLVSETVTLAGRVQAWAAGPGLGTDAHAAATLEAILAQNVPVLVDADGLTLLASNRALLAGRAGVPAATVLTPHDREFARLFGEVGTDRIGAARRAAAESGAVVLLKGFATIVASPDGRCAVNPTGTPALATAGSGDVLSGLIGSLLAAGLDPVDAAATGAFLHGRAGALAAQQGPVTSEDLLPALRRVLRR